MSVATPSLRRVASYQGELLESGGLLDNSMLGKSSFPGPHRTQLPPRATLVGGRSMMDPLPRWRARASFLFTFILIVLSLLYLSTFSYASRVTLEGTEAIGYGIVIDAGSSGCRLHVYKYTAGRPVPQIFPADLSLKIRPGLSSFADNPSAAGASLTQLMEFAHENVPASKRKETPIFLMATAGLRRVEASVAEEILESCRKVLASSGFMFRPDWASVISGTFEGVYAWVAANYALGNLGMPAAETTGVVELGGASAQVSLRHGYPNLSRLIRFVSNNGCTMT